jgi:hypothetical protein
MDEMNEMNEIKIQVGDIVNVRGVVGYVSGDGDFDVVAEGGEDYGSFMTPGRAVTFVSRPEKTVSVELTENEISALRALSVTADWSLPPHTELFNKLTHALNDTP